MTSPAAAAQRVLSGIVGSSLARQAIAVAPLAGLGIAGGLLLAAVLKPGTAGAAEPTPPSGPAQPPGVPPVLSLLKKSSGPWVTFLQQKLGIPATGTFDAATDAAVRAFQGQHSLTVDGIVGQDTWKALGVTAGAKPGGKPPKPAGQTPDFLGAADPFGLSEDVGEREQQMIAFVQQGAIDHQWWPLTWTDKGHTVSVEVSRRALALSSGAARLTVNATMPTAQKIADVLGGVLLTTRVSDEIQKQANAKTPVLSKNWNVVNPNLKDADGSGSKTFRMYDQSEDIDDHLSGITAAGLIANEGKDWVTTRRFWLPADGGTGTPDKLHSPANFGWYPGSSKSPGGASVVQSVGLAHGMSHTDYSQLLRFLRPSSLKIDGKTADLLLTLVDPVLSYLLNDEGGVLPGVRHPDL